MVRFVQYFGAAASLDAGLGHSRIARGAGVLDLRIRMGFELLCTLGKWNLREAFECGRHLWFVACWIVESLYRTGECVWVGQEVKGKSSVWSLRFNHQLC